MCVWLLFVRLFFPSTENVHVRHVQVFEGDTAQEIKRVSCG